MKGRSKRSSRFLEMAGLLVSLRNSALISLATSSETIVQQTNHPTYCFTSTCNSSSKITALYAEAAVIADHWPQPHRHRESILLSWSRAGVIGTIANFLPSPQNGNQSSCPIAADEGNLHEHKRLQAKSRKPRYEHEVTEWQCRDQSRYLFASRCNIRTSC